MREEIERRQVWIYLAAIGLGLAIGGLAPQVGPFLETLLWPCLATLLFATFVQVPLDHLPEAFRDRRFISVVLFANFAILPLLVWGLLRLVPDEPAVRLGVLLVLLVPCTDWFITFTHLAGGDTRRAIAITPINLLVQIALLPGYLWLFMGDGFTEILSAGRMLTVFGLLIVAPLLLAFLVERWATRRGVRKAVVIRLSWLPVPLLAAVVFLIAGSQAETVASSLPVFGSVFVAFVLFLLGAAVLGVVISRVFSLGVPQARTLVFSLATRNSFVVLPFALALPAGWDIAVVVIVFQSLIELFGMVGFLWWVPRRLLPEAKVVV